MEWKRPRNRREVQQYLGLCNYYRRFIPEFSDTAAPLTELTIKHVDFRWSKAAEESFLGLKNALCSVPILAFPLEDGEFVLDTDASNLGIGGVLQQRQGDDEKVITYTSKKLNKQQRRYCVTRRELLAIVVCLREFRNHLLGREFTICTDHGSLAWLLNFKVPQGQLARWLEYIFQFRFRIVHRDRKKHTNADALSRNPAHEEGCNDYRPGVALEDLPCGGCSYCRKHHEEWGDFHNEVDDVVPLSQPCRQVSTRSQTKYSWLGSGPTDATENSGDSAAVKQSCNHSKFKSIHRAQRGPSWSGWADIRQGTCQQRRRKMQFWRNFTAGSTKGENPNGMKRWVWVLACGVTGYESLRCVDSVLYLEWQDPRQGSSPVLKLLVPESLKEEVLRLCHDSLFAGHMGVRRTLDRVRRGFHWYGIQRDVKLHVRACPTCAATKMPYRKYRSAMANFRVRAPLDRLGIDIMGPLPTTTRGNRYLFVICDYFTRWVEAFPLPDQKAETVAQVLVHEFICLFGAPLEIHSDRGRNFESSLFREVCRLLRFRKTRSTPYHPSSNGLVERFNRTLASLLRSYIEEHQEEWDVQVPILTCAYRSTSHPSTGFTPNYLMLGREVMTPVDLTFPTYQDHASGVPEYVLNMQARFAASYGIAREKLLRAAEQQKKTHDVRMVTEEYKVGDAVWKKATRHTKLTLPWCGPYIVHGILSDCLYRIADKKKTYVVHHDIVKPCHHEDLPRWALKLRDQLTIVKA